MKGYSVYNAIQQLKAKGFKKATVARQLDINRRTVDRYWDMSVDEYEARHSDVRRKQSMDEYQKTIIDWLTSYPSLSSAQVCDWLKENYDAYFSERTVSRYVKELREKFNLPKHADKRTYEAVPELPMGKQVQVDFGESSMKNTSGNYTKVYTVAFLLSHSRYKYVELQSRPFTSAALVSACYRCFAYFGGMPEEMVFDQDSIVCVSENAGDIVFTYEFEKFRQSCGMSIYMCRGADPQSKGKIENTVKYVKGNFIANRIYIDDESLNASCIKWLARTANAKIHGTTKKIPAEEFKLERETLRPLPGEPDIPKANICRTVRKDNTIIYNSNRYTVPYDTYNKFDEVRIEDKDGTLYISSLEGLPICQHRISTNRGVLVQNIDHKRDKSTAIDKLQLSIDEQLGFAATGFLESIREQKSRYAKDQFRMIQALIDLYGCEYCLDAVAFCVRSKLYSANTMKDYLEHISLQSDEPLEIFSFSGIPLDDVKYHVTTEKRPLSEYMKVGEQNVNTY